MFTNVWISGLFVVLAVAVFIILCFKDVHTGIAALIATLIAALGSANSFYVSVFEIFPSGVASLVHLPRKVGMIAAQGIAPAINFCMPVPNVPGSLPNMFLGTGLFDAPILSIATGLVGIALFLVYQTRLVKKARANGEGYDGDANVDLDMNEEELPSFLSSVLPLVAVVAAAIVLSQIGSMNDAYTTWATQLVALAQFVGVLVLIALHFSRCKKIGFSKILSKGCTGMWPFLLLAGCVFGFGQVVTTSAVIAPVQEWVLGLSLNPYITAMISVAIIAGLCTDGISAMMVWLPMFGQQYLDMGVNAGALRRLVLCTTQTFDSLPHAQSIASTLGVFGLTHKQAYKELFVTTVIFPSIFSIFCCICCIIFYSV